MQRWPFLHSSSIAHSCAVMYPGPGAPHELLSGRSWHSTAPVKVDVFSTPQQLSPPGQSQEYRQCTGSAGAVHPASIPGTHA